MICSCNHRNRVDHGSSQNPTAIMMYIKLSHSRRLSVVSSLADCGALTTAVAIPLILQLGDPLYISVGLPLLNVLPLVRRVFAFGKSNLHFQPAAAALPSIKQTTSVMSNGTDVGQSRSENDGAAARTQKGVGTHLKYMRSGTSVSPFSSCFCLSLRISRFCIRSRLFRMGSWLS